jgi:hypothetical protein
MLLYTMLRNAGSYVCCRTSAIIIMGKEERSTVGRGIGRDVNSGLGYPINSNLDYYTAVL